MNTLHPDHDIPRHMLYNAFIKAIIKASHLSAVTQGIPQLNL
jgi:hypothetical protein